MTKDINSHKAYGELLLTLIKSSLIDLVMFAKHSNPKDIKSLSHYHKKSVSNSLYKHWHPSDYSNAYGFLFSDEYILRFNKENLTEGLTDTSLLGLMKELPNEYDIESARLFLLQTINKHLGFIPADGIGLQVFVKTKNNEVDVKKLEASIFDKLIQLTKDDTLQWQISKDPNEKGSAPDLIELHKMRLEGTYFSSFSNGQGTLVCILSKYTKCTEKKKNYSEYVINVQLNTDSNSGYDNYLISKGMSRLWNLVEKDAPIQSGNLSTRELNNFLSGLIE